MTTYEVVFRNIATGGRVRRVHRDAFTPDGIYYGREDALETAQTLNRIEQREGRNVCWTTREAGERTMNSSDLRDDGWKCRRGLWHVSDLLEANAACDCGWEVDSANAKGVGAQHARKNGAGHDVTVTETRATHYCTHPA